MFDLITARESSFNDITIVLAPCRSILIECDPCFMVGDRLFRIAIRELISSLRWPLLILVFEKTSFLMVMDRGF